MIRPFTARTLLPLVVLTGCALERPAASRTVVDPTSSSRARAAEPVATEWRLLPIHMQASYAQSMPDLDPEMREVLAESTRRYAARGMRGVRLVSEVHAAGTCLHGEPAGRGAREREIEDGDLEVYFRFEPRDYVARVADVLVAEGIPRSHIEVVHSERARQGREATEYAQLWVRIAVAVPIAPAPLPRADVGAADPR